MKFDYIFQVDTNKFQAEEVDIMSKQLQEMGCDNFLIIPDTIQVYNSFACREKLLDLKEKIEEILGKTDVNCIV